MQGSRVLLLEVQALTASSVIGAAKRKVTGVSSDRVAMIMAVLEKRAEMRLAADDVFVNVAGGVKVMEPAIDLAIALAIASAHTNRPLPPGTLAVGELGLGGEVRSVPQLDTRLREASRLGVGHAIVPPVGEHAPSSAAWPCTRSAGSAKRWPTCDFRSQLLSFYTLTLFSKPRLSPEFKPTATHRQIKNGPT